VGRPKDQDFEHDKDSFSVANVFHDDTYTIFLDPTSKHSQLDDSQGYTNNSDRVYIQYATMFVTPYKQRMVRVHNLCLFPTNNDTILFKNVDACACVCALFAATVNHVLSPMAPSPSMSIISSSNNNVYLNDAHKKLYDVCLSLLYNYRVLCATQAPKNHLILPESLRLLPLYAFTMLKHPGKLPGFI
jgi:hypothetical protein